MDYPLMYFDDCHTRPRNAANGVRVRTRLIVGLLTLVASSIAIDSLARADELPGNIIFHQHAAWSPDGSRLALSVYQHDTFQIYLMNADGSGRERLTDGSNDMWATWSPDGQRIAYTSKKFGTKDIWVTAVDRSFLSRLTTGDHPASAPAWSPDGRHIAYTAQLGERWQLFIMAADGGDQQRLTTSDTDDYNPRWSPDGSRLLFYAADATGANTVCVINRDGTGRKPLTDGTFPDWGPDGNRYVFDWGGDIYIANIDGTERVNFVENGFCATWSHHGRIAFVRKTREGWPAPSEILVVDAGAPVPEAVTGKPDTSLRTIKGQITRIDDDVPRDGGVTIHIQLNTGGPARLFLGSLRTRPPPSPEKQAIYQLIVTLRAGDKVEAVGRPTDGGYTIEHLKKLPGTITKW